MAINIRKITRDLANDDQDVRVLALTTCMQLTSKAAENKEDFKPLYTALCALASGTNADLAFLAKKGQAHVRSILEGLGMEVSGDAAAAGAAGPTRDEVLAGLRVETDPMELARLVALLKKHQGDDLLQLALQFTRHKEPRVRAAAAQVVHAKADERGRTVVLAPMLADPDARVRATAATGLAPVPMATIAAVLGEMLASPRMPMKEAAVWAAGRLKGDELVAVLARGAQEPNAPIRARAARGVANQKAPAGQPVVAKLAGDPDATVREEARRALAVLAGKAPPPDPLIDLPELAATLEPEDLATPVAGTPAKQAQTSAQQQAKDEIEKIEKMLSGKTTLPRLELTGKSYDQLLGMEGEFLIGLGRAVGEACRTGKLQHPEVMKHYYDYLEYRDKLKQRRERGHDQDVSLTGSLFNLMRAKVGSTVADDPVRKLEERLQAAILGMARTGLALAEKGEIQFTGADEYVKRHQALRQAIATAKGGAGTP